MAQGEDQLPGSVINVDGQGGRFGLLHDSYFSLLSWSARRLLSFTAAQGCETKMNATSCPGVSTAAAVGADGDRSLSDDSATAFPKNFYFSYWGLRQIFLWRIVPCNSEGTIQIGQKLLVVNIKVVKLLLH